MKIFSFLGCLFVLSFSQHTFSDAPSCDLHRGKPYCSYKGKVKSIYINSGNLILIYFDKNLDPSVASNVGINNVTHTNATAYRMKGDSEFGKLLYSTALTAQATGREVSLQMRGVESGYLKVDRVWLSE